MQKMLSLIRRCADDYAMLPKEGRVAVGVSGGKDSLALLAAMTELSRFHPSGFQLHAITVDMGFPQMDYSSIEDFCKKIGVPFTIQKTDIAQVVFDIRKEENPCSLCAKLRRGALHEAALAQGCNTVALGHHFDDAVETFILSLFYEGRLHCFSPKTYLDRRNITLIRPLLYATELQVRSFAKRYELPVIHNPCPADGATKRQEIKDLLFTLEKRFPDLRSHLFGAMQRLPLPGWEKIGKTANAPEAADLSLLSNLLNECEVNQP